MYRSLRVRLLALVLIGIGTLTLVDILVSNWGLINIRDRAIAGSSTALRSQAETYLHKLALDRALSIDQALNTIQQITATTQRYLTHTRSAQPSAVALAMQTTPTGQRYSYETTMVLLSTGADDPHVMDDIAASSSLDALLPGLIQTTPEVDRISYLTPRGMMRTFPALNVTRVPASWTVQTDPSYQLGLKNRLEAIEWTQVHSTLDSNKPVISATAPIHRGTHLQGIVVVDVSLGQLTAALERMKVEQTGFAFLFDRDGHLIAASAEAQRRLSGRGTSSDAQGHATPDKGRLGANLTSMRAGSDVTTIDLDGQVYLLTYAQILTLDWTLGLAVPLDEITATAATTTQEITSIADTTQTRGLVAALAAVGLLGLVMSALLRRQFVQPLSTLIRATKAATSDGLHQVTITSDDELGQLATSFNTMTKAIQASRAEIMATNQRLEQTVRERTADLELAVVKTEQALATQQELLRVLREVSTPVIPMFAGVLVMPLIGQLDDERVCNATNTLLTRIERYHAHTVLLDLTGVPLIDTRAAQALLQMAATSQLLGAEVLLVGIAPEIAQTIVALSVDMRCLHTAADMQSAVEQIMTRAPSRLKHRAAK